MEIVVNYCAVDGYSQSKKFKTLLGAQKFAQKWIGEDADVGSFYAVSTDGVGRITCSGCSIKDLFKRS